MSRNVLSQNSGRTRSALVAVVVALLLTGISTAISAQAQIVRIELVASLESPTPQAGAMFGGSVSTSGDTVVIGEPYRVVDGESKAGRAYIFDSEGGLVAPLGPPDPQTEAYFGWAVAVSGNTVVVGEPGYDLSPGSDEGRHHYYDTDGERRETTPGPKPTPGGCYGYSEARKGSHTVTGDPGYNEETGMAYIRNDSLVKILDPPDPQEGARFGHSVAACSKVAVIGEPYAKVGYYIKAGKAHIYDYEGKLIKTLTSQDPDVDNWFGWSVACCDNFIVVGEPGYDTFDEEKIHDAGRVWIFDTEGKYIRDLIPYQPGTLGHFGWSVACSDGIIVVGEPGATVDGKFYAGRVWIIDSSTWDRTPINPPDPQEWAGFGTSVSIQGNIIVIGEPGYDTSGESDEGRAHIFRIIALPPVGGEVLPVDRLALAAPFIAIIALVVGSAALYRRRPLFH